MNKKIILFPMLFCFIIISNIYSQEENNKYNKWVNIDKGLLFNRVIVQNYEGRTVEGLLSGMIGDSLYLDQKNKQNMIIDLHKIRSLIIYDGRSSSDGILYGMLAGMYAGNLILSTNKNPNEKYIAYNGLGSLVLLNLLYLTAGGAIGYPVDQSLVREKIVFYFSENFEENKLKIKSLKEFLSSDKSKGNLYINIDMSQVFTRKSSLSEDNQRNLYNDYPIRTRSFNLLRKISITYMFFPNIELGCTICWFGEPNLDYLTLYNINKCCDYKYVDINETFHAIGYFFIANYHLLNNILPSFLEFSAGAGFGLSKIDYLNKYSSDEYIYPNSTHNERIININLKKISYIMTSRMNLYLSSKSYFSLLCDYVIVPGKTLPAIPELSLKERQFGNFSIGLGVGFNF